MELKRGIFLSVVGTVLTLSTIGLTQPTIQAVGYSITPEPVPKIAEPTPEPVGAPVKDIWSLDTWAWVFEGGGDSLAARCIGAAEGTRTVTGAINPAYYGHTDPGNRVWNKGSFSYQHGPNLTPEQADETQLARLRGQGEKILAQAKETGLILNTLAFMQILDSLNQSPTSGMGSRVSPRSRGVVYLMTDRVVAGLARNGDYSPEDIIEARTKAFIDPLTGAWTSSGLCLKGYGCRNYVAARHDQHRRYWACSNAIAAYRNEGKIPEGF